MKDNISKDDTFDWEGFEREIERRLWSEKNKKIINHDDKKPEEMSSFEKKTRSEEVIKAVKETTSYDACARYVKIYYKKLNSEFCDRVIENKLYELCFEDGIIPIERAQFYSSNIYFCISVSTREKVTDRHTLYFKKVFNDFNTNTIATYNANSTIEKHRFLLKQTIDYFDGLDSFYEAAGEHHIFLKHFPELDGQMRDKLFSLCFDKRNCLDPNHASSYVEYYGKKDKHSKWLLNRFLRHCIGYLLSSFVVCLGGLYLFFTLKNGVICCILIPFIIGAGLLAIQYIFKTISALINYGKEKNFNFNTGSLSYQKGSGGAGHIKYVSDPTIKG